MPQKMYVNYKLKAGLYFSESSVVYWKMLS